MILGVYLYLLAAAIIFKTSFGLQQQQQYPQNRHCAAAAACLLAVLFPSPPALAIDPVIGVNYVDTPMIIATPSVKVVIVTKPPTQRREFMKLQYLEDARLKQCEEKGKHWEHCFIFGTDTKNSNEKHKDESKHRPPTW
jgi:hypothetical protein